MTYVMDDLDDFFERQRTRILADLYPRLGTQPESAEDDLADDEGDPDDGEERSSD